MFNGPDANVFVPSSSTTSVAAPASKIPASANGNRCWTVWFKTSGNSPAAKAAVALVAMSFSVTATMLTVWPVTALKSAAICCWRAILSGCSSIVHIVISSAKADDSMVAESNSPAPILVNFFIVSSSRSSGYSLRPKIGPSLIRRTNFALRSS